MLYGYAGKMLFVDLTTGKTWTEPVTEEFARNFIGGYGFGARVLYENMPKGTDPYGEESMIGFTTGPLTGTGAVMSGRYTVVCKSPVTGKWNDANSGGFFGPELKKAGYDCVFVRGKSETPVYIWITEDKVEIWDASKLWGLEVEATEEALKEELGEPKLRAAMIGPAGESLTQMAAVMNDGHRAAGRAGGGAVMGSKKLKAVAVRGNKPIPVADPEAFREQNRINTQLITKPSEAMAVAIGAFSAYGTGLFNIGSALSGDSPVKNWGGSGVDDIGEEEAQKLNLPTFDEKYKTRKYACANCAFGCGAFYDVKDGKYPIGRTARPEYETWASFGTNCLNTDIEVIMKCNEICNQYGLDTISVGSTLAWVMEAYEHGDLTKDQLDDLEATWGNAEFMVQMTEKIAKNEGAGEHLRNGIKYAVEHFGVGQAYDTTAGGIEPGMHDGRLSNGYARIFQFDPTPGRHVKSGNAGAGQDAEDRISSDLFMLALTELANTTGMCFFFHAFLGPQAFTDGILKQVENVTGFKFSQEEMMQTGQRIYAARHLFNLREGETRKDKTISPRLVGNPPLNRGPLKGVVVDNERRGDELYTSLGWDLQSLVPSKKAMDALGGLEAYYADLKYEV
jgi:aldehyde:ferredoxin oxidoreductase